MSAQRDFEEIARATRGDSAAQNALVRRHMPRLHAVATRMLGDSAAAEDVVQETFVKAWQAMPGWTPDARFSTWLHRVALNLCYDYLRRRRDVTGVELPEQTDPDLRPDDRLDQAERVSRIEAAIASLPERQRAALVLCRLEGHTNIEAADIMEISVEALESLLARARRTLRAMLSEGTEAAHG
ncbi:MAG: RNA polymerase sigma factor [Pseudomonadota bacterium]